MKPTELLTAEHRVIEQGLDCLEEIARRCEASGRLDGTRARAALEFIREFADKCHHGKEEAHLFRIMEEKGFPRQDGPIAVMLAEHDQGRAHVRAMAAAAELASGGDADACQSFRSHAAGFVSLLRQHIQKEDHCLFPMADQALDSPGQSRLEELFRQVDDREIGKETRHRLLGAVDGLAAELGVSGGRGDAHATLTLGDPAAASGPK